MDELKKLKIPREEIEERKRLKQEQKINDDQASSIHERITAAMASQRSSVRVPRISLVNRQILESNGFVLQAARTGLVIHTRPAKRQMDWIITWDGAVKYNANAMRVDSPVHNVRLAGGAGGFGAVNLRGSTDFVASNLPQLNEMSRPTPTGTHNVVITGPGAGGAFARNIEEILLHN